MARRLGVGARRCAPRAGWPRTTCAPLCAGAPPATPGALWRGGDRAACFSRASFSFAIDSRTPGLLVRSRDGEVAATRGLPDATCFGTTRFGAVLADPAKLTGLVSEAFGALTARSLAADTA